MSEIEARVARHYGIEGLLDRIMAALAASGVSTDRLRAEDLERVDEFHIGGAAATAELLDRMGVGAGQSLIDLGSGIGGPARHAARRRGARVTGIDLTESFVAMAAELSRRAGMGDAVRFVQGSILDLPFEDASFDAAMLLHVGMNVDDKRRLVAEAARVLKPGGVFGVYEVMRLKPGEPEFPVPWAATPETSFLATPDEYRAAAAAAGLEPGAERERRAFAIEFFATIRARMQEAAAQGATPPPGLPLVMGENAAAKIANLTAALEAGLLAPVEMILRKPE